MTDAVNRAVEHVGEREVVFSHADLLAVALAYEPGSATVQEAEWAVEVLERDGRLHGAMAPDRGRHWTTDACQRRREYVPARRRIVADASLVEADAAVESLVERDDVDPNAPALKHYEHRYHDFKKGKRRRKLANQTHVSASDPDATLVSRPGVDKKRRYKAHFSAYADRRMITDCYATTGARHECPILPARIEYPRDALGLPIEEVIAERGYGRGPTCTQLREQKIRHHIPLHDPNTGRGKLTPSDFEYDRRQGRYRCPRGHSLYPYEKIECGSVRRFRITGGHCKRCPLNSSCLPDSQKFGARFVDRGIHQDEVEAVRHRQSTATFRQRLVERKWKIEGLFGEAKQNHGLQRARYRGLPKVQIQFFMIAIALDCTRVVTCAFLFRLIYLALRRILFDRQYLLGELRYEPGRAPTPA